MVGKPYRTQILLEPEQHRQLFDIAKREGRSLSDVVRTMLAQQLEQREHDKEALVNKRLAALERIREHKEAILRSRCGKYLDFDVLEAINKGREEQDERN